MNEWLEKELANCAFRDKRIEKRFKSDVSINAKVHIFLKLSTSDTYI